MHGGTTPAPRGPWSRRYAAFEDLVTATCMVLGLTLILYGVIMRYLFSSPVYWVDEISTYLVVWAAILGWAVAERDGRHIRVTLLFDRLSARARRVADISASVVSAGFCLILAYMALVLELRYFESGQLTLNTQSPLWIVYSSVPVAALMLGGRYVVKCVDLLRAGPAATGVRPPSPTDLIAR
ncbi:MAG: TRAP transporter small permease [Acidobacteria bacterium]|nr:TRAP transporter small permease [Acidobacteriota bacterium]